MHLSDDDDQHSDSQKDLPPSYVMPTAETATETVAETVTETVTETTEVEESSNMTLPEVIT
jgi:hypothetical protein